MTDTERISQLEARVRKYEEDEASVCPEDVGFVEWIGVLKKRAETTEAALKAALWRARDRLYRHQSATTKEIVQQCDEALAMADRTCNAADAAAQAERE